MDKLIIKSNWNRMAKEYESFTNHEESYSNLIEWEAIKSVLPDLKNKTILDLGCGTGRFGFLFESMCPNRIIGIDWSEEMIEIGKKYAVDRKSNVEFINNSIEDLTGIETASIDFVFSSTTLHYVKELDNIMRQISRILVPSGICILSVIHPVYSACYPISHENGTFPEDDEWTLRYLDKRIRGYVQPWIEYNREIDKFLSHSYHHTMSDYINNIVKNGLIVKELLEPLAPDNWRINNPKRYESFLNTPTYAIFKMEKS